PAQLVANLRPNIVRPRPDQAEQAAQAVPGWPGQLAEVVRREWSDRQPVPVAADLLVDLSGVAAGRCQREDGLARAARQVGRLAQRPPPPDQDDRAGLTKAHLDLVPGGTDADDLAEVVLQPLVLGQDLAE